MLNSTLTNMLESLKNIHEALFTKKVRTLVKRTMLLAGTVTILASAYSLENHPFFAKIWIAAMILHIYQNKRTILK